MIDDVSEAGINKVPLDVVENYNCDKGGPVAC